MQGISLTPLDGLGDGFDRPFSMVKQRRKRKSLRGRPVRQWHRPPQLRVWRLYRGMTVEGLAEKAEVSPGLISQIENGQSNGSPDSLQKLAVALRCTVQELFADPIPGHRRLDIAVPEQDFERIYAAVIVLIGARPDSDA